MTHEGGAATNPGRTPTEDNSVVADLDFTLIDKRKQLMDSRGHYSAD